MHDHRRTYISLGLLMLASAGAAHGAGNGLRGEYYNNNALLGSPTVVRTDATVNVDWNYEGPAPGISPNRFSIRWTGQLEAPLSGAYRFSTISDSGIKLWVNNALIINNWNSHSTERNNSAPVMLTAGQKYNIRIDYYENTGNATARLYWTAPGQQEKVIPKANLYSEPVTQALPTPVYLSNMDPTFSQNGWGPYHRDRSNGETGWGDGRTLGVGGVKFGKGLGVHARSELRYNLAKRFKTFSAFVGIDDEVANRGSVVFQVWLDGAKAFESPILRGTNEPKFVEVKVAEKNELKLIVLDGGDGIGYDHADWADARLHNGNGSGTPSPTPIPTPTPTLPSAPSELTAAPGNQQILLSWKSASGAATYNVYRGTSPGGVGATPIKTGLTATQFLNAELNNGTRYYFKVAAANAAGVGPMSNEASGMPAAPSAPMPPPTGLTAAPGDKQVTLAWNAVAGAATYNLYRGTASNGQSATPVMMGITGTTAVNTGLTNNTKYFFKVAAVSSSNVVSERSNEANATPVPPPPPPAPSGLSATPGDKQVTLNWTAVQGATSYNLYRGTSSNGQSSTPVMTGITGTSAINNSLTNNTKYFFKVAAVNTNGVSERSNEAFATPVPPPPPGAPAGLSATGGDKQIVLSWNSVTGATSYNVYRGTKTNTQATTPIATLIAGTTYTDPNLTNGTPYFYKVASVNANGISDKSNEASATPTAPGLVLTTQQREAFRFLRQTTFGPNLALADRLVQIGKPAFLDEQFAAPQSVYPQELIDMPNMELVSERFFQNAMQGQDQLRLRTAWALSQIFVVSAVTVDNTHAMVPYIRMLHTRAFDNAKDIMRDMALSPAMGEFLDMVNNKKASGGILPNENFAREWMQLFTIGLQMLNDDGTPVMGPNGPLPSYTQDDVLEFTRVLTGWTYGDALANNTLTKLNKQYYDGPMEPVENFHDTGVKVVMGQTFPAGQNARADFEQALTLLFNHQNTPPFLVRQLIQRLVTSNPSPTYIRDVVQVFKNNGQGVRGDLRAVIRAILLHPESANGTPTSGKFSEPALFIATLARALGATVADHPFMTDFSESMAQRVFFAPSVFNYFSPNFRSGALFAPEMQIWTTANAMTRTNFVASLVSGGFGSNVVIDYAPFTSVAPDINALVDTVNARIMGGTLSQQHRQAILTALGATTSTTERVRTALYLAAASMQYQVER